MLKLMKKNTDDGARIYTPLTLKLYDWWVLGVSNRLAWGCPTKEHLLPHFLEHLGNNHLDIGVGTGFYLTHVPESSLISLMDLNEASLNAASTRAGESKIKHKISHDVFEPYPAALHGQFDSISMFYLLHCLPGNISTKSCVIRNAAQALTDDGTLPAYRFIGAGNGSIEQVIEISHSASRYCILARPRSVISAATPAETRNAVPGSTNATGSSRVA